MALNIDNLVINRALSGSMLNRSTGEAFYSLNQITEPSLECSGEQVYAVDALGSRVATFDRNKEASLSGSNAFVNLGLAAAQFGSDKKVASEDNKIVVPVREVVTVKSGVATLSANPVGAAVDPTAIVSVSIMTKDGGIVQTLSQADEAAEGKFKLGTTTIGDGDNSKTVGQITVTCADATNLVVLYKKESASAIQIENRADCFAKGGEFWLEVLFVDPCDTNTEYHGFLVFPNAKMSNETTIDFNNEATHGFTIEAMQDYCDADKKLFYIVVSE